MVVDSSALIAILQDEAERQLFVETIAAAPTRLVSSATMLEAAMVLLTRRGTKMLDELRAFVSRASVEIVPFDAVQMDIAIDAFRRYGKGRHPAALNFGDCFSYALAQSTGEPLLFKGGDFSRTDIRSAAKS